MRAFAARELVTEIECVGLVADFRQAPVDAVARGIKKPRPHPARFDFRAGTAVTFQGAFHVHPIFQDHVIGIVVEERIRILDIAFQVLVADDGIDFMVIEVGPGDLIRHRQVDRAVGGPLVGDALVINPVLAFAVDQERRVRGVGRAEVRGNIRGPEDRVMRAGGPRTVE